MGEDTSCVERCLKRQTRAIDTAHDLVTSPGKMTWFVYSRILSALGVYRATSLIIPRRREVPLLDRSTMWRMRCTRAEWYARIFANQKRRKQALMGRQWRSQQKFLNWGPMERLKVRKIFRVGLTRGIYCWVLICLRDSRPWIV